MLEDLKNKIKMIYESCDYKKMFKEEEEGMGNENHIDFVHTGTDGISYSVKVEPDEQECHVFDKNGKLLDIFTPSLATQNGGISSQVRKEILTDYQQNHSQNQDGGGSQSEVTETALQEEKTK